MGYLIIGNFLLAKEEQKAFVDNTDWHRNYELD